MKTQLAITQWLTVLAFSLTGLFTFNAFAQGTAFTYQGRLNNGANPAGGIYDVRFTVYDDAGAGNVWGVLTNAATPVTNGLFTVTLDFGSGVFTGNPRWLEIAVRTNSATAFATLAPRQPITPTPYAITAENLNGYLPASQVSGVLPLAQLPASIVTNNAINATLAGSFFGNFGGLFYGSGNGLTGLNPANISAGTAAINISGTAATATSAVSATNLIGNVADAQVPPNLARLNGTNLFTGTNNFTGVVIATNVNNVIAGVFTGNGGGLTNLNTAQFANSVLTNGETGLTLGGSFSGNGASVTNVNAAQLNGLNATNFWQTGGNAGTTAGTNFIGTTDNQPLELWVNGSRALRLEPNPVGANIIAGAANNSVAGYNTTIAGGLGNSVQASDSLVGGGMQNSIQSGGDRSVLVGGYNNSIQTNADASFLGGGGGNTIQDYFSFLGGGSGNSIQTNAHYSFLGGGNGNSIQPGAFFSVLVGGAANSIQTNDSYSVLVGGSGNSMQMNSDNSVLVGGSYNAIQPSSHGTFLGGGFGNSIQSASAYSFLGGGSGNSIQTNNNASVLVGGTGNSIQPGGYLSVLGGGYYNTILSGAGYSFIGGGNNNTNGAVYAVVAGGNLNFAGGQNSFAAGQQAKAIYSGDFVWADVQYADFNATAVNQFLIRAANGVGINTNNPQSALHVNGTVTATAFAGNGSGLTALNASQLSGGTIPLAQLPAAVVTNNETGITLGGTFSGSLNGNATTATTATNFTGNLSGNVTGTQNATVVASVGGQTAANIASGASAANAANNDAIANTIVKRDTGGSFTNNSITLNGNLNLPATTSGAGIIYFGGVPTIQSVGGENIFAGWRAGNLTMTGANNAGLGDTALNNNTSGNGNTAVGSATLVGNTSGSCNTAVGGSALFHNSGSWNIALGYNAGGNLTTGSSNIDIGNMGTATDTNLIRIGDQQTQTFIAGQINGNGGGLTNLNATKLTGTLPLSQLPTAVVTNNAAGLNLTGTFTGNGAGVTNVNAAQLNGLNATNFWQLGGNNVSSGQILGSTNFQPVEIWVNNTRALRLEPNATSGSFSNLVNVIGGSLNNFIAAGVYGSVIAGGAGKYYGTSYTNSIAADLSFLGSGVNNSIQTNASYSFLGGGYGNSIQTLANYSFLGGGYGNSIQTNASSSFLGGGNYNSIQTYAFCSFLGGGYNNAIQTNASYSFLGGGNNNSIQPNAYFSFLGGGYINTNGAPYSSVPGGDQNYAGGANSFAAGHRAKANYQGDFVWADSQNADFSSTANDQFLIRAQGGVGINKANPATALDVNGTVTATSFSGSGSGLTSLNANNLSSGTMPLAQLPAVVITNAATGANAVALGYQTVASALYAVVSGGTRNAATGAGAVVAGGGYDGSTIISNSASGAGSTIAGGTQNVASGSRSTVGGGHNNTVTNNYATVPGGAWNIAGGQGSFAAGQAAHAVHDGTFVWNCDWANTVTSTAANQFLARAEGGFYFYTGTGSAGATLAAGATAWSVMSDRNAKKDFAAISPVDILNKLASMPITQWHYKWEATDTPPHIGPMAQDFKAAFYPGTDDKTISTLEADGVELAAIQGLNQKLDAKDAEIQELKQSVAELKQLVQTLVEKK
jgi:hypothetical protein